MKKFRGIVPEGPRRSRMAYACLQRLQLISDVARVALWLLMLPLWIWQRCVAVGIGALRAFVRTMFGLIGFALVIAPALGILYVLLYPWIK